MRTLTWLDFGCTCPSCVFTPLTFFTADFTALGNAQVYSVHLTGADFCLGRVLCRLAHWISIVGRLMCHH